MRSRSSSASIDPEPSTRVRSPPMSRAAQRPVPYRAPMAVSASAVRGSAGSDSGVSNMMSAKLSTPTAASLVLSEPRAVIRVREPHLRWMTAHFVHIPKSGGSSVGRVLRRVLRHAPRHVFAQMLRRVMCHALRNVISHVLDELLGRVLRHEVVVPPRRDARRKLRPQQTPRRRLEPPAPQLRRAGHVREFEVWGSQQQLLAPGATVELALMATQEAEWPRVLGAARRSVFTLT